MIYATRMEIEAIWGEDFTSDLLPEDVDADQAYAGALANASSEIDIHLSARYQLPLPEAPAALVTPCVNIAVYNLAIRHTALTTTIEDRYKQACELLKRIAEGRAAGGAMAAPPSRPPALTPAAVFSPPPNRHLGRRTFRAPAVVMLSTRAGGTRGCPWGLSPLPDPPI